MFFLLQCCDVNSVESSFYKMQRLEERLVEDPGDNDAFDGFVKYSRNRNSITRANALAFLGRCYSGTSEQRSKILPLLKRGLKDGRQSVRRTSAAQLIDFGVDALPLLKDLIGLLKEGNNDVAWFAAEALGNLGGVAEPAVPALIESLNVGADSDYLQLRVYAAEALGKIGPPAKAALPALQMAAKDSHRSFATAAEAAIKKIQAE